MRTTTETREWLESSAARSGRSLVQEVEHLVEQAKAEDQRLGGPLTRALVEMLTAAVLDAEQRTKKSWLSDATTFNRLRLTVTAIIGRLSSPAARRQFETLDKRAYGVSCAKALLEYAGYSSPKIDKAIEALTGEPE